MGSFKDFTYKLAEKIRDKEIKLTKQQLIILCILLVLVAILLGLGIKALASLGKPKTIDDDSKVFVEKDITFTRNDEPVQIGDLIIFKRENALDGYLIKRVAALEGATVDISEEGFVLVNGVKYETDKLYHKKDVAMPVTVPQGAVFVLGDSDESVDSRISYVGFVSLEEIEGKEKK